MIEALKDLTIGQMIGSASLLAAALGTVIQISPIKINPWSYLARKLGQAINKEVIDKVEKLENDFKAFRKVEDERDIKAARARILRFGDELFHGVKHSKEHFDDVLDDMTAYDNYCSSHKDFKNDKTKLTSQYIREVYSHCMEDSSFI